MTCILVLFRNHIVVLLSGWLIDEEEGEENDMCNEEYVMWYIVVVGAISNETRGTQQDLENCKEKN